MSPIRQDSAPPDNHWEAQWRALMGAMPDPVWLKDTQGTYLACNAAFSQRLGLSPDDMIGRRDDDLMSASLAAHFRASDQRALQASGPLTTIESDPLGVDSVRGVFEFTKIPVRDADGRLLGLLGMARDVTLQRATERQLREANENLQATLAALPDLVMEVAADGTYLMVLTPQDQRVAETADPLPGRRIREVLPEPAATICMHALELAHRQGHGRGRPFALDLADGRHWFEISFRRKHNGDGQAPSFIGLMRDVTLRHRAEQALRITLDSMAQGISQFDADGHLTLYNRRFQELLDFPDEFMSTRPTLFDQLRRQTERGDFPAGSAGPMQTYLRTRRLEDIPPTYCRHLASGRVLQIDTQVLPDGGMVRTFSDVTSYFDIQHQLRREQEHLGQILDGTQAGTWDWNTATGETVVNERWAEIIGQRLDEITPLTRDRFLALIHPEDRDRSLFRWQLYARGEADRYECDIRLRHRDGHWVWVLSRGRAYAWDDQGQPLRVAGTELDISELKLAEDRLRHIAQHDPLTGLPNRVLMGDRLQRAIALARRERHLLSLMFVDLDRFKAINDTLGHDIGDVVLRQAAQRMVECMRETDSVARMGGDEFVVLLEGLDNPDDALMVAEKLRQCLEAPFEVSQHRLSVAASIGVAIYPQHGKDDAALLVSADHAMYQAKNRGGNQVRLAQVS